MCSVTNSPPTLLVCANRTNDSYPAMKENAALCVNTLASAHEELSPVFAGMTEHTMAARFEGAKWHTLLTGAPVLDGALVAFDCRIEQIVEVGTHDVFICSVEAVEVGTTHEGLIYYARGYHRVTHGGNPRAGFCKRRAARSRQDQRVSADMMWACKLIGTMTAW